MLQPMTSSLSHSLVQPQQHSMVSSGFHFFHLPKRNDSAVLLVFKKEIISFIEGEIGLEILKVGSIMKEYQILLLYIIFWQSVMTFKVVGDL